MNLEAINYIRNPKDAILGPTILSGLIRLPVEKTGNTESIMFLLTVINPPTIFCRRNLPISVLDSYEILPRFEIDHSQSPYGLNDAKDASALILSICGLPSSTC